MGTPFVPVEVFYSFADADASLLEQLEHHLSVLRREGQITTWHKRQVTAGSDWQVELDQHLNTASLILLLISPDFLASDYQYGVELQRAVQRHDANEARVIPIALRACEWEGAPFQRFQVIPRNGKAITSWRNRDEAFAEIAREIRLALEAMQQLTVGAPFLALPKIWQIPYPRNPIFTGREDLLHALTGLLQTDHAAVLSQWQTQAISGLGGIGKTQLAVEYAYRTAHQYQEVFWVRAETRETLVSGYTTLAEALHLREKDEQDQNRIIQAVRNWLQTHKGWLLILDNADDLSLVEPLLPPVYGGRILLTTRAHTTGRFAHRIEIDTLTNAEGALLLLRRAGMLSAQGVLNTVEEYEMVLARQISELLGNLPLALDQAGAYIEETRCSLLSYRQQYEKRRAVLLARRGQLATDHPDSVATTWSLSFEKVELSSSIAAQVLRLCAFLAPDAIPEELLVHALVSGALSMVQAPDGEKSFPAPMTEQEKEWESTHQAEKAWEIDEVGAILSAYSLMQRNPQEATIGVHRLVQTILRESMSEEERHMWAERTVRVVKETLPGIAFANWKRCEQYMPHAQECMQLVTERIVAEETQVLHWIGAYLLERQRTHEAGPYVQQALAFNEQHLGREHPKTAASLDRVARWLELQGKYAQAEPLYVRALTIFEQQLGVQHPDTASSLNNLAHLYKNQGKYAQAEPLLVRTLVIREQQMGAEHPDTAISLNNLASLYDHQGKYTQAEPLLERALVICEQQMGAEHPDTAISLNNLAMLYEHQGKYAQAEPLLVRALAIREQQLGTEHCDTALGLNNLALLYEHQGKYAQAEPLYVRALTIFEQQLGVQHPDTASSLNNLALLYQKQEKDEQAEPLLMRALAICEQQLGAEHPDTARSLNNLASLYYEQGKYAQAEPLYLRALAIYEQALGAQHPSTASSLNNLAGLYERQGKYAQAEPLYVRALAIRKQQLGAQHPDTASSLDNLAGLYERQGKDEQAEPLYLQALAIYEQALGAQHPATARSLNNLAMLYENQGKDEQAEPLYLRALAICEQQLGTQHPATVISLENLAGLYYEQGKYAQAEPLYVRVLAICEQQLGTQHPATASSLNNLAMLYERQGKYEQAAPLYMRALAICEYILGPNHPNTQKARANYTTLLQAMGSDGDAKPREESC